LLLYPSKLHCPAQETTLEQRQDNKKKTLNKHISLSSKIALQNNIGEASINGGHLLLCNRLLCSWECTNTSLNLNKISLTNLGLRFTTNLNYTQMFFGYAVKSSSTASSFTKFTISRPVSIPSCLMKATLLNCLTFCTNFTSSNVPMLKA